MLQNSRAPLADVWADLRKRLPELPKVSAPQNLPVIDRRKALVALWRETSPHTNFGRTPPAEVEMPACQDDWFDRAVRAYAYQLSGPMGRLVERHRTLPAGYVRTNDI